MNVKERVAGLEARARPQAPVVVKSRVAAAAAAALLEQAAAMRDCPDSSNAALEEAYSVAQRFPWDMIERNDTAALHIGNPFSPYLADEAPRYPYSELEAQQDASAVQARLAGCAVASALADDDGEASCLTDDIAFLAHYDANFLRDLDGPGKLVFYKRLAAHPAAVLAAAASLSLIHI